MGRMTQTTVLIVENEALVRKELAVRLADMGLIVLVASDADEAIALLDSYPEIEVMFTDIRMPGTMDGVRLAHHVRHRWPPIRIIVASGLINTRLCELPVGSIFLSKPYAPDTLVEALTQMIDLPATAVALHNQGLGA
jgi:CheY-like chemotaxis protein